MEKNSKNLTTLNKQKLGKKSQEKEDEIKVNLQMEPKSLVTGIFQIHWNTLEWFNPRIRSEGKDPFFVSSKKFYLKDNDNTSYWVSH